MQDEVIRKVDNLVNASLKFHGLPKSHYDDRMGLAMQWNKFPNLKDHAVGIILSISNFRVRNADCAMDGGTGGDRLI